MNIDPTLMVFRPLLITFTLRANTVLAMCYSGISASSLIVKEAISEVLKNLQHAPPFTDFGMDGIIEFIFNSYKYISTQVCCDFGPDAASKIIVAGYCHKQHTLRAFLLEMDSSSQYICKEILSNEGDFQMIGSGTIMAQNILPKNSGNKDYLCALREVIEDPNVPSVGGNIQYGYFEGTDKFKICGIYECKNGAVHYWRGGLDLNDKAFQSHSSLLATLPLITPFEDQ